MGKFTAPLHMAAAIFPILPGVHQEEIGGGLSIKLRQCRGVDQAVAAPGGLGLDLRPGGFLDDHPAG